MNDHQPPASPTQPTKAQILCAWTAYSRDVGTFVRDCVFIYDATAQDWVRFALWPAQVQTLQTMAASRKLVILKARQLGISWLSLGYALWLLLFQWSNAPVSADRPARNGSQYHAATGAQMTGHRGINLSPVV